MPCPLPTPVSAPATGRRLRATLRRRLDSDEGLSLVELMVAFTVLFVVMTGTAAGLASALGLSETNRGRTVAANLATQEMELQRSAKFATHQAGAAPVKTAVVGGRTYEVAVTKEWVGGSTTTVTGCEVASAAPAPSAFLRVTVEVTWPAMGTVSPVRSQTVIGPPATDYSPYAAHLVVSVLDSAPAPAAGHLVQVSGGPTAVAGKLTNDDGCAVFPYLRPGTYTVTLGTAEHVGAEFAAGAFPATPTRSVSLPAAETHVAQFEYERAGILDLRLAGPAGGVAPAWMPVTLRHSRLQPAGAATVSVTGALALPVFPFPDGFEVSAGADTCTASRATPARVLQPAPGQTLPPTNLLATVALTVRRQSAVVSEHGLLEPNKAITVRATAQDPGCAATHDLSTTTDASGVAYLALPYGSWELAAVDKNGTKPVVTLGSDATAYPAEIYVEGL